MGGSFSGEFKYSADALSAFGQWSGVMGRSVMNELDVITQRLRKFAKDRDWDQFHSPKNLTMALSVEVAELAEHFQWLTEDQSKTLDDKTMAEVTDEIADVQAYLIRLADIPLNIPSHVFMLMHVFKLFMQVPLKL